MNMLIVILSTIVYLFFVDMLWLGFIAKNLYDQEIGSLIRKMGDQMDPNWLAASLVYLCMALGIVYFVLAKSNGNIFQAILWGALFGTLIYGVYDFTNMAVLANWTWKISIIDVIWGTVLCSTASGFAMLVYRWLSV